MEDGQIRGLVIDEVDGGVLILYYAEGSTIFM
jgi:hypothetical protein